MAAVRPRAECEATPLPVVGPLARARADRTRQRPGPSRALLDAMDRVGVDRLHLDLDERDRTSGDTSFREALEAMLSRLDRDVAALRQFSSDAAHQLRTPLAVLSARTSMPDDAFDREALAGDLRWMGRLIDQLLATTRSSLAAIEPDGTFETEELSTDVVCALVPLAISRGRDLQLVRAEAGATVLGSYDLAFEALSNLVENALDHAPVDSMVSVRLEGGLVEVADQGRGVPPEERERIFERFGQGRRKTTGGAGLGLAIVREIMERHGGAVACGEAVGGGALFSLRFRCAADASDQGSAVIACSRQVGESVACDAAGDGTGRDRP